MCKKRKKMQIRLEAEVHRSLKILLAKKEVSLQSFIENLIKKVIKEYK